MKIIPTKLEDVRIIEPQVFEDSRGFFMETWNQFRYAELKIPTDFIQDNLSYSGKGVLRGLHFQNPDAQGKLVYVLQGEVLDIAVDIRTGSPTFGQWVGAVLSSENRHQFYIPEGFAHGFCVTSKTALFAYKCTRAYNPQAEHGIIWDDPDLNIEWSIDSPRLSEKDQRYPCLKNIDPQLLPQYQGRKNQIQL